ncbi:hypothetical protein AGMMS50212_10960 [Spirochaetia bacterium]|nr:hypothetical protein AGMMS50212_10960 [Spirochaetia bacterium]
MPHNIYFFAGGAFSNFSVFMLGIMPYISMSIIMQLLLIVFPTLKKISQEEGGRKKIQMYQRYGTVVVCLIQSFAVTQYAQSISRSVDNLLSMSLLSFTLVAMLSVTTGTMLLMWMGEQITKRGIGNGISLLIFAGIVARLPSAVIELGGHVRNGDLNLVFVVIVFIMFVAVVTLVVFEQQGQRKITVHYAKRVVGRRMYGENLFVLLERRLDNVVYRMRFAASRSQARQLVLHSHILVNGKKVNIPSFLVKPEDTIEIKEKSKNLPMVKEALKEYGKSGVMPWLQLDPDAMKGKYLASPRRSDITDLTDIKEQMIVEYYSK